MSTHPMIPDKRALEVTLLSLLAALTLTLFKVHDVPALSDTSLRTLSISLHKYLIFSISRNKRRSHTPLDPSSLAFDLLRTYNSSETTTGANGKKVKEKKDWYYLVLTETNHVSGSIQILVEGMIRREKGEVLDGFMEEVDDQVLFWEEVENEEMERDKGMKSEEMKVWVDMEREVEQEREEKMKAKTEMWMERQREVVRKGRDKKEGNRGGLEDIEEGDEDEDMEIKEVNGKSVGFMNEPKMDDV